MLYEFPGIVHCTVYIIDISMFIYYYSKWVAPKNLLKNSIPNSNFTLTNYGTVKRRNIMKFLFESTHQNMIGICQYRHLDDITTFKKEFEMIFKTSTIFQCQLNVKIHLT